MIIASSCYDEDNNDNVYNRVKLFFSKKNKKQFFYCKQNSKYYLEWTSDVN